MSTHKDTSPVCDCATSIAFIPRYTMRCMGTPTCRTQHALDVATLLDVDDTIISWSCNMPAVSLNGHFYKFDFTAEHVLGRSFIMAASEGIDLDVFASVEADNIDCNLHIYRPSDLNRIRLQNANDILVYSRFRVSLDERLRLLCLLNEFGSASIAECMTALRSQSPMAALSSLFLHRLIEIELDDALIGPDTIVRRKRL